MFKTALQRALFFIGLAFSMAILARYSLGLPDWTEFLFQGGAFICLVAIFVVARRNRSEKQPSDSVSSKTGPMLLALVMIIAMSLSGPWWLPYTGVHLTFPQLVVISLISCVVSLAIWLIAWRRDRKA